MLRLLGASSPESLAPPDEPLAGRRNDPLQPLAQRAMRRDRAAELTLLTTVGPALLGVVRRVLGAHHPEVEDVCQEAAVGLLSALPGFRGECSLMHFGCRIALLAALTARRRGARWLCSDTAAGEDRDDFVDGTPSPAELVDSARRRQVLRGLLDDLPLPQAEVLALHVVLGYTVEETGAMTGAAINTVRSRLRRGLGALRERVGSSSQLREVMEGSHEPD